MLSLIASEFGSGQVFWSFLWFFMFFIWIWLLIAVFSDIFRSHDLNGWAKAPLDDLHHHPPVPRGVRLPDRPRPQDERARRRSGQGPGRGVQDLRPAGRRNDRCAEHRRRARAAARPAPVGRPRRRRVRHGEGQGPRRRSFPSGRGRRRSPASSWCAPPARRATSPSTRRRCGGRRVGPTRAVARPSSVVIADGTTTEVLGPPWNARTAVHEYGGGAWWVPDGVLWFADWATQRLHRVDPGGEPVALTPDPPVARGLRYADGDVSPDGSTILCVQEAHPVDGDRGGQHDRAPGGPRAVGSGGRRERLRLRVRSPLEPGRPDVLLARVGPPGHAVGRHPAGRRHRR